MDKKLFSEMLKEFLKENAKLKLYINEDRKGMYDNSVSYTFEVELEIDGETITSTKDTLYLG
jgi:hypothetical protein